MPSAYSKGERQEEARVRFTQQDVKAQTWPRRPDAYTCPQTHGGKGELRAWRTISQVTVFPKQKAILGDAIDKPKHVFFGSGW